MIDLGWHAERLAADLDRVARGERRIPATGPSLRPRCSASCAASIASAGQTVILVTHDAEVSASCDRIIRMLDGLIVGDERRMAEAEAPAA